MLTSGLMKTTVGQKEGDLKGSICKFCHAPILWLEQSRYVDEDGNWRNDRLPLDLVGGTHYCPVLEKKRFQNCSRGYAETLG